MKKIILCINDNKFLTLTAVVLGVLVGIFGSATGWGAVFAGVITGSSVLALENLRRAYNDTWSIYRGKRWALLTGMAVSISVLLAGCGSIVFNPTESLGIFACIAAILVTLSTAQTFCVLAWNNYNPNQGKINLIIWSAFLGIIGLMAIANFALILQLVGKYSVTDLLNDDIIVYGGCVSLGLIGVWVITVLIYYIGYIWDKMVDWARK